MRLFLSLLEGDTLTDATPVIATGDVELVRTVAKAMVARMGLAQVPSSVAREARGRLHAGSGTQDSDCRPDEALTALVLTAIRENPGGLTTRAVRGAVRARDGKIDAALRRLEAAGRATRAPGPHRALIWRAEGSSSGAAKKARPERGPAHGHGAVNQAM